MTSKEDTSKLVEYGSKLTGSAISGTVGSFIGLSVAGPPGAIGGALIGNLLGTLTEIGGDFLHKKLSKKEEIRVGAAFNYTLHKVQQHLDNGEEPRKDDFFEVKINTQSKAEEIFEGVLIKSQLQYQEKKIRIISNIFANAAFREDVSVEELHHMLRIVDELTYRELCILALINQKSNCDDTLSYTPGQRKIGLIFPSDYAIVKEENFIVGDLDNFSPVQSLATRNKEIETETKRYLLPFPQKSENFYYLYKELMRLKNYDLIGEFFREFSVDKTKVLKEKPQLNFQENNYSVFTFNRGFFADKYSDIMSLDDIDYADLEDLNKYIEPNLFLNHDVKTANYFLLYIDRPDYLVTHIYSQEPAKLPPPKRNQNENPNS